MHIIALAILFFKKIYSPSIRDPPPIHMHMAMLFLIFTLICRTLIWKHFMCGGGIWFVVKRKKL